jgi:hypothetical protein
MAKLYKVTLTEKERSELGFLGKKKKVSAKRLKRAQALLLVDQGEQGLQKTDSEVSEFIGLSVSTLENLRKRFVLEGFEAALSDKKRNRIYERKLDGLGEAQLIQLACSESPEGSSSWTLNLLSDKLVELKVVDSISKSTVRRTLKKTN